MGDRLSMLDLASLPTVNPTTTLPDITQPPKLSAATQALVDQQKQHDEILSRPMDRSSGLPDPGFRSVLATDSRPEDQAKMLQQLLKKHYGSDVPVVPWGDDNMVYKNPQSGVWTLAKPSALTAPWQAVSSLEPMAAEAAGALGGGVGGMAAGGGPLSPTGILGGLVGAAATGTAARETNAAMLRSMYGVDDPRSVSDVTGDIASTAAANMLGQGLIPAAGAAFQGLRTVAGETLPRLIAKPGVGAAALPATIEGKISASINNDPIPANLAQQRVQAANRLGIDAPTGTLTGNPSVMKKEQTAAGMSIGSDAINQKIANTITGMGAKADEISASIAGPPGAGGVTMTGTGGAPVMANTGAPATRLTAGDAVQSVAKTVSDAFVQREKDLKDAALSTIGGPNARGPIANIVATRTRLAADPDINLNVKQPAIDAADQIIATSGSATGSTPPGPSGLLDASGNPILRPRGFASVNAMLDQRSALGDQIWSAEQNQPGTPMATSAQYLKQIRDALNKDLDATFTDLGGAQGQKALDAHDQYVTQMRDPQFAGFNQVPMSQISRLGARQPDALVGSLISGRGVAAQRTIQMMRDTIFAANPNLKPGQVPQQWRDLAAAIFDRMGTPTGAATGEAEAAGFSPLKFATAWSNMDPGTRRALFQGYLDPRTESEIYDFATMSKAMQESAKYHNWVQSGNVVNNISNLYHLGLGAGRLAAHGDPVPLLAAIGSSFGPGQLARLMQNPNFVRWLTGTGRLVQAGQPGWAANAIARLGAVGLNPADSQTIRNALNNPTQATP